MASRILWRDRAVKLNTPNTETRAFRYVLDASLGYLTGDGSAPELVFQCKPGGYLNPGYMVALEAADVARQADLLDMAGIEGPAARAAAHDKIARDHGERLLLAFYDHCVVSWSTNIQDGGAEMEGDREHFLSLGEERIPGMAEAYKGAVKFAEDFTSFIAKADEDTEKTDWRSPVVAAVHGGRGSLPRTQGGAGLRRKGQTGKLMGMVGVHTAKRIAAAGHGRGGNPHVGNSCLLRLYRPDLDDAYLRS